MGISCPQYGHQLPTAWASEIQLRPSLPLGRALGVHPLSLCLAQWIGEVCDHCRPLRAPAILSADGIGREALAAHIANEPGADAPPAWLFPSPAQPAARPGQFLAVVEPATEPLDPVGE